MKSSLFEALDRLGKMKRTGWLLAKIPYDLAESVAEHTLKVALISIYVTSEISRNRKPDLGKIIKMALIHDFPEAVISDIPKPIKIRVGSEIFNEISLQVLENLLGRLDHDGNLTRLFEEYIRGESIEAKIVALADNIATYIQCLIYEREYGIKTPYLDEIKRTVYSRLLEYLEGMNLNLDDLLSHLVT